MFTFTMVGGGKINGTHGSSGVACVSGLHCFLGFTYLFSFLHVVS